MPWRPHGRAQFNPRDPRPAAICDDCGFMFNLQDLQWNFEWAGNKLVNQRTLVCQKCNDEPNPQLRTRSLPPDPTPIKNPRPENADVGTIVPLSVKDILGL